MKIQFATPLLCIIVAITANAQAVKNVIPDVARPLPLSSVRLTGGPLKKAQDLNAEYLLKLEPDKAAGYPGWDAEHSSRSH